MWSARRNDISANAICHCLELYRDRVRAANRRRVRAVREARQDAFLQGTNLLQFYECVRTDASFFI